jgi:NTE family protein
MRVPFTALIAPLMAVLATGCAHYPINPPLARQSLTNGYYFHTQIRPNNSDNLLFVLAFSGGGTRAAAFSYGVLEELNRTSIHPQSAGATRRLIDEVDAISAVSGGSVTAGAYALYGDEVFTNFETAFLKRNVQGTLLRRMLNPFRWDKLWSSTYGRSELAAEYYDEILYHGATFGDVHQKPGPFVVLNATDVSTGARFDFTQYQFDLLCSDLSQFPLSRAVAASSAVPALLTPVTVNNYAGSCCFNSPEWFGGGTNLTRRQRFRAREQRLLLDSTNRPYIHLVDGGVADNLGIRAVLDGILNIELNPGLATFYDFEKLSRVVLMSVNAFSSPERDWDKKESPPGTLQIAMAGATITIDRYSYETIELFQAQVDHWQERIRKLNGDRTRLNGNGTTRKEVEFYPILINFTNVKDLAKRRYFLNLPTSLALPAKDVDNLRDAGGRLLRQSPEFQKLVRDLGGTPPGPPP